MDETNASRTTMCCALLAACALLAGCGSGDGFVGSGGASGPLGRISIRFKRTSSSRSASIVIPARMRRSGLRLDAANSYALLVGIASGERPNLLRVAPGDPNNSYLIQKLEGTAGIGERMPAGLPALPQADIDVIRQWITDGAQPSSSASGTDPRHVVVAGAELDGAGAAGVDHGRLQSRAQRAVRHDGDVHAAARRRRRRARHGRRRRDHAGIGDRARPRTRARPS